MSKVTSNEVMPKRPVPRKKLIDSTLQACGWKVALFVDGKPLAAQDNCAIEEYPTSAGPADYALCVDGQIIGIVEAKKLTLRPQNVLSQAERYSKGLEQAGLRFGEYGVPFLYSTNGEVIWHHDIRHRLNRSRQITRFHTPDADGGFGRDSRVKRMFSIKRIADEALISA